ncbi:CARDB domain-containing protein [Chloroflexota bacterium]
MKKVTIVLMISLALSLLISTTGCHKVEEMRVKIEDMISGPTVTDTPTSASAPIHTPSEKSSAPVPSTSIAPLTLETPQTKTGGDTQPPLSSTIPEPDLIIQDITWSPLNPSPGETVTFTVTIKNQGGGSAAASQVSYYVDGSQKGSSTVSSIPAGGTVVETFSWNVERLTYTVKTIADYKDNVLESNETNNEKAITFSENPGPEPDLIIQDITWSPLNPSSGETITFTVTIKNQGGSSAVASQINYYLDGSQKGSSILSSIPAGGTATATFTWQSKSGNHTIKAVADYKDNVHESDETNNEKVITSSKIYLADLIIQNITWSPPNPSQWETVTFTVTVKNQGVGSAIASQVNYYFDGSQEGYSVLSSIPAGGTRTATFTWLAKSGKHTITAVADHYDSVLESNESNNFKKVTLSIGSPTADLIIQKITWSPLNPSPGETVTFTVTIKNQGGGNAVASQVSYYVDDQHGTSAVSSISAGSTADVTFTWPAKSGNHTIKAVADDMDNVSETKETNNGKQTTFSGTRLIDLVIEDITWSPLNPFLGETFTYTVTVKNQGEDKAGSFQVYYYIDGSQKGASTVSSIAAGSTTDVTFTWNAELGAHVIKAVADYNDDVSETNEANNEKETTFSGTAVRKPDLIIQDITWSLLNPAPGETIPFTVTVKNQGSGNALSFWVHYYIDGSQEDIAARVLGIPAGETWAEILTWKAALGTHRIKVIADQYNQIDELDDANNEKEIILVIE